MNRMERKKEILKKMQGRGRMLPPKDQLMLLADAPEAELNRPDKSSGVTGPVLQFQSTEQVEKPRTEQNGYIKVVFHEEDNDRRNGGLDEHAQPVQQRIHPLLAFDNKAVGSRR